MLRHLQGGVFSYGGNLFRDTLQDRKCVFWIIEHMVPYPRWASLLKTHNKDDREDKKGRGHDGLVATGVWGGEISLRSWYSNSGHL